MPNRDRLLSRILARQAGSNISFRDLRSPLMCLGFEERISGSHHIFTRGDIAENIILQPSRGQVKTYQIQQARLVFEKYGNAEE